MDEVHDIIATGARKGKERATRVYVHVHVWVQCKYKTLALMVSIFGNQTLILTLHDSPWSHVKSDTYKSHSFDKADMAKCASEAEDDLERSMFALRKKLLFIPLEMLREDWIVWEEFMTCYPGSVPYFSCPLEFFLYASTYTSTQILAALRRSTHVPRASPAWGMCKSVWRLHMYKYVWNCMTNTQGTTRRTYAIN